MKRDHTQLLCNISELSGLFEDAQSLHSFLQKIVDMTAEHMKADVCSIYLFYEDRNELVLTATHGLNSNSINNVKLKLGEGLTGLALKELRPICERNASQNPNFKYFPGIGEEKYESFLVVPIVRGQNRIGAMVLQNAQKNYFTEQDIAAFRAVTSQLANTIETTKLLMILDQGAREGAKAPRHKDLTLVKGRVGAQGYAFAEAVILDSRGEGIFIDEKKLEKPVTLQDFYAAVRAAEEQLDALQKQIEEQLSDVASLIFTAQLLMLKDPSFIDPIVKMIEKGVNPPRAVLAVVENYAKKFQGIANAYLQEKSQDVRDIGRRLLENLIGKDGSLKSWEGRIVIAEELLPSDALKLSSQKIKGIILLSGGVTSHLSILARSLHIPLVIADTPELLTLPVGTKVFLDADQGNIYINPSIEILDSFKKKEEAQRKVARLKSKVTSETLTRDGTRVTLLANINLLGDITTALEAKAEGVGLYRTEFPFIVRSDFPTEEEQFVIYKKLVDRMKGKEIIFRTLDIGGDKVLSYYHHAREENPFLGMRSIRFSLQHKEVFIQQVRAILRAGAEAPVKIMFPMISSLDEFMEAKEIVLACARNLKKEKIFCSQDVQIGLMVELPAVLEIIDELAQEADFFSIGTNDFVQYMLAVDRTNEKVADFYLPHHPSVIRAFKKVAVAALKYNKDISICGDMVHETQYIPYFLGIGIRKFSVNPQYIPKVQAVIAAVDLPRAEKETAVLLASSRISDTTRLVARMSSPG